MVRSRLTKKIFNNNNYAVNSIPSESDGVYYCDINVLNKLGKLEDLEEQIGCPLEIIFKATENGIIDYEGKGHIVVYAEKYLFAVEDDELKCAFYLKNYKKTWWLKGEQQ